MATHSSSGRASRRGLRITLFMLIVLFGAVAVVLGLCLNKNGELSVTPENNLRSDAIDSAALLSSDGWNNDMALMLNSALSNQGDNIAFGNAGGVISAKVISLGGYSWSVVYKQNGIVTLYANQPVAYLAFDKTSASYADSAIREYLNNEFYADFVAKIGYNDFDKLIVPFGVNDLYYQMEGAQAISINTVYGDDIINNDGITQDKIWLPSAYEVGGFESNATSPVARVNSFKTIKEIGFNVNTGLWNLSNLSRLSVDNVLLRSNAGDGVAYLKNGLVNKGDSANVYAIRPCFNMVLPQVNNGVVVDARDSGYAENDSLLAGVTPDFTAQLRKYTTETTGNTFTPKTGSTTVDGVSMTYSQLLLLELADAVNAGQDMAGKTFNLIEDVDMSVVTVWNPIGRKNFVFSGVFNGNGYKISNLCGAGSGFVGLFGYVSGSSAKVSQVAVVDSAWYTTNSEVGAIAGVIANGALVEQCYSASGIAGGNNVGGIVGKSTSTSTIRNCYNVNGVAGINDVGGIIGSNSGTTVTNCYNVGAVSATGAKAGGIVGEHLSGTYSGKSVYSSANNTSDNASIANVDGALYSTMQGSKTSTGIVKPTALSTWTFDGNPWTISATLNERLPILKCFVKQVTLNVRSSDASNLVSINGGAYATTATLSRAITATGAVTVSARAQFSGSNHYILNSWNLFEESLGGLIISTDVVYANAGNATTSGNYRIFTLQFATLDDSYNLEAIFEKLYSFSVSPVFNGFSNTSTYDSTELNIATTATPFESVWYRAGDTVTVTIGTPKNRSWKFAGLTGSLDGGSTWSAVTVGDAGAFISATDKAKGPFVATIGHSSVYVSQDTYVLRPTFNRYYNITLANNIPSIINPPTIVSSITLSSPAATIKSSAANKTAELIYNGTITTGIDTAASVYSDYFTFQSWELLDGSVAINSWTNTANTGIVIPTQNNSVISLTMRANFKLADNTVSIEEKVGSTANSSAGIYTLSTDSSLTTVTADSGPLTVPYGTTIYLYVLPNFSAGYVYSSFSKSGVAPSNVGSAGLLKFSFEVTKTETYTITYALASQFSIAFNAKLDGTDAQAGVFTFTPASYSNLNINSSISGATVTNEAGKYFLSSISVSYGNKNNVSIVSNPRPAGGYEAQTSNTLFASLGATQTVAGLLSKIGATAQYNVYNITVTANFISIIRTISVTETWHGVDANGGTISLAHAKAYTITDTTLNKTVEGQGVLNNAHKLTANPGKGYKVASITVTGLDTAVTPTYTGTVWVNHVGTADFTLAKNVTIAIVYEAHSYTVNVTDNLSTLGAGANTYVFKIGDTVIPVSGNTIHVNVGNTLTISGYSTIKGVGTNQKAQLKSFTVQAATTETITQIDTQWSKTFGDSDLYETLTLTLNYIKLQSVNIVLQDQSGSSTGANKALVILKDKSKVNPNIVLLVEKGNTSTVYADCVMGVEYEVSAVIPVYVSTTSNSTGKIIISDTSDKITVELKQDLQNASVYSSEIF